VGCGPAVEKQCSRLLFWGISVYVYGLLPLWVLFYAVDIWCRLLVGGYLYRCMGCSLCLCCRYAVAFRLDYLLGGYVYMCTGSSLCWCCGYAVAVRYRLLVWVGSVYVYGLLPVLVLSPCCSGSVYTNIFGGICIYVWAAPCVGAVSML
jgi:hypothetical protein